MHLLLLGGSGYIGSEFVRAIQSRGHQLTCLSRKDCDLYAQGALKIAIEQLSPDFLVNCAGYTGKPNVDACELDKTNCLNGNAILPGIIAEACDALRVPWGHVSSGCIFTGRRSDGHGFTELDPPNFTFRQNNCSFYSGCKALGEELLQSFSNLYMWRLRIPYSHVDSPRNYLSKILHYNTLLDAENSISHLPEFVAAALDCVENRVPYGVYNLTNPGSVNTREVVELIRKAGITKKEFKFFSSEEGLYASCRKNATIKLCSGFIESHLGGLEADTGRGVASSMFITVAACSLSAGVEPLGDRSLLL